MSLPASENTTTLRQAYVIKENGNLNAHIKITNSGSAINQGDLVLKAPYFGVADEDIGASSGTGTIHVEQEINVGAAVTGSAQTFATWGQAVYYDQDDGKLYESGATDATRWLIGYVSVVADANGVFSIDCLRFPVQGVAAST